jgi:protein-S-isoprenylcysteine O-methyltransferase Ste14
VIGSTCEPDGSWSREVLLALRSVLWAMLLPGVFAGYVPWRFFGLNQASLDLRHPTTIPGVILMMVGTVLLFACIVEFARTGRGTLSPLDPPRRLVVRGLYRYVRNPMYLSVTLIVFGEALLARSSGLILYWLIWFSAVNVFVIGYEEPALRTEFGESYHEYARRVGRWIPSWP